MFASFRNAKWGLYLKRADGVGNDELLIESEFPLEGPTSWSPDGRFIVYMCIHPETGTDICILPLTGDRKPIPFLMEPGAEGYGQISPDGTVSKCPP